MISAFWPACLKILRSVDFSLALVKGLNISFASARRAIAATARFIFDIARRYVSVEIAPWRGRGGGGED
jgi:hypothetical protein